MKKALSGLLAILVMLSSLMVATPVLAAEEDEGGNNTFLTLYVSPDGDDVTGNGTKNKPYQTIAAAKAAVRDLIALGLNERGDIVVEIADGFYPLDDVLTFDASDSGSENGIIRYEAAAGAKPVVSGGRRLESEWTVADDVDWLGDGLVAYKAELNRDEKLRAIYVNGQRAAMTMRTARADTTNCATGSVSIGDADYVWNNRSGFRKENRFSNSVFPAGTRNQQNIELETQTTWNRAIVCVDSLDEDRADGYTFAKFQMPYGGLTQTIGWADYKPSGNQTIYNVFEWLDKAGQFYFDQANSTVYYIPRPGEDMSTAEVVVPELERLVDVRGSYTFDGEGEDQVKTGTSYAQYITFKGLTFAYTDWNLYKLENSSGYATVQGCIVAEKFGNSDWHKDMYRSYDVPPAAITVNTAHDIKVLDGSIRMTGCLGVHLENDVSNCEITGNDISETGGGGIIIGHPQHIYENDDPAIHKVPGGTASNPTAPASEEKFRFGTESVPKDIRITNNYLYRNCYFFPGHSPIASFFTQRMEVLHNFIYQCPYGGMSIGWGWCNWDGSPANITDSNTLPGVATHTSFENTVSYNRVEEIGQILHDTGGIYTLGQQGNPGTDPTAPGGIYAPENWTNVTHMDYNYINVSRTPQVADGSRMLNGFHPDEGSKFIKFDGNVITNIIRNVYEMNNWKRKMYMQVTNGFSNTSRSETTAPNCTIDMYVDETYTWPPTGHDIVLNSGLEDKYAHLAQQEVMPDSYYELASNVRVGGGYVLNRRGLLAADDEVWLVPADTVVGDGFGLVEGDTMTKSAGNEKTMTAPTVSGEYKLYIKYADGSISEPSFFTLYVGARIANVKDGERYQVSYSQPLKLDLNTKNFSYTLNGKPLENNYSITTDGTWQLVATAITEGFEGGVINFTTYVADADKLLPYPLRDVKPGSTIRFATNLQDAAKEIWVAPYATDPENLVESERMTKVSGNSSTITLPTDLSIDGGYRIYVVDGENVAVSGAGIWPATDDLTVTSGLDLWLKADAGVTTAGDGDNGVTGWSNQATGEMADKVLTPANDAARPTLMEDAEKGYKYIDFDANSRQLQVTDFKNYTGNAGMTVFAVNLPRSNYDSIGWGNGDQSSVIYINEVPANWGGMSLSVGNNGIAARFGSGSNNVATRFTKPINSLSNTMIMKDGSSQYIYLDGQQVAADSNKSATLANLGTTLSVGRALAGTAQPAYTGRVAEILVYDRALTEAEIQAVNSYLNTKYFGSGSVDTTAEEVAEKITSLSDVAPGESRLTFPQIPEGFSVEVKSSNPSIIDAYGNVTVPDEITNVELTLTVYRLSDNTSADTKSFNIKVYPNMTAQNVADMLTLSDVKSEDMWINLPEVPYGFTVKVKSAAPDIIDANGNVTKPEEATDVDVVLTVTKLSDKSTADTASMKIKVYPAAPLPTIPSNGLDIWLMADRGVTVENGEVTSWKNQAAGDLSDVTMVPSNNTKRPQWKSDEENEYRYIYFDQNSKQLIAEEVKDYNRRPGMTVIAVNLPEATYTGLSGNNCDKRSAVYFNESGSYGGVNLGVGTNGIGSRFGDGTGNPAYNRYSGNFNKLTSMMTMKNETNYSIYVNGKVVSTATGSNVNTANIGQNLMIGGCLYQEDMPYQGRIAEVLIYDRTLTDEEIAAVSTYIDKKYFQGANELAALVEACEKVENEDYTTASWTAFETALKAAQEVLANDQALSEDIETAMTNLQEALDNLTKRSNADTSTLQMLYDEASAITKGNYTDPSWDAFQDALSQAEILLADESATQTAIDDMVITLIMAKNGLQLKAEKGVLNYFIEVADTLPNLDYCTPSSVEALQAALEAARPVAEDPEATQEDVNAAANALKDALLNLRDIVDNAYLLKLIEAAEAMDTSKYTAESVKALEDAIDAAKLVTENVEAYPEDVREAYDALASAMIGLTLEINRSELANLIVQAEDILKNSDRYSPATLTELPAALEAAQKVLDNADATQEEINQAAVDLAAVIAQVRIKANKTVLVENVEKANQINETLYTSESVRDLSAALKAANEAIADENATQDTVDEANSALLKAIDGLVLRGSEPADSEKPSKPGDTVTPGAQGTGDSSVMTILLALALLALSGATVLYLRKKRSI